MARKLYLRDFSHKKSAGFRKFIGNEKNEKIGDTMEIVNRGNKKGELLKIFQSAIEKSGGDEGETMARVQKGLKENKYFANSDVRQIMDEAKRSGYFISSRSVSSDKPIAPDEPVGNHLSAIRPRAAYKLRGKKADLYKSGARGVGAGMSRSGEGKNSPPSATPVFRRPMF